MVALLFFHPKLAYNNILGMTSYKNQNQAYQIYCVSFIFKKKLNIFQILFIGSPVENAVNMYRICVVTAKIAFCFPVFVRALTCYQRQKL